MANHHYVHDVFLSFRGEARHGFTGDLYNALLDRGIEAFIDDDLKIGDEIGPILIEKIEQSRMSMVVLSKDYASSGWCLDELIKIIQCYDNQTQQVLIIFYMVEPSDILEQKYSYDMKILKERYGHESEKVKAWGAALSRACDLSREHCREDTYQSELIQKIVKDTLSKLPDLPPENEHIVGLKSQVEQVESFIDVEPYNTVHLLEIFGAGGLGKTTLAENLYDNIHHKFEAACFLERVRETYNKSITGLEHLQKRMLSEMTGEAEIMIGSTFEGASEIKLKLGGTRVLLVLDDVDSTIQLDALAGGGDWFGPGSRIIITTRDTSLLDNHEMKSVVIEKYEMQELNNEHSLELFCWHAFKMRRPRINFENHSSRAISYAKGFPLALELIGSHLKSKKSIKEWDEELVEYEQVSSNEINKKIHEGVLEISYKRLFHLHQKSFLDIACFFKGEKWKYVQSILTASDFFPLRVLVSKCLINVDENDCLKMHDLIEDMGRKIVRRESHENPSHCSRLWSHEEIIQVLQRDSGSSIVEGILLDPPKLMTVDPWANSAFKKMDNLRILIVRNTIFSKGPTYLPNKLRLIDWKGYPSKSFPPDFHPHRIVDFKLPHSPLVLDKPFQVFEDLTFINLSQCQSITRIPDVSGAKKLRVLTLDKCQKLVGFDNSVGFMPSLVYLSASECNALKSFVKEMYLPSLEVLSFNFCGRLEHFPQVMDKMDKPLKIHMINTAIEEFPESIGNLTGLDYIDMSTCKGLKDLSNSFLLLPKLVTLKIDGCSQLGESFKRFKKSHSIANGSTNIVTLSLSEANLTAEDLHVILEIFPKLEELNVSRNGFVSLPEGIKRSLNLKRLDVSYCRNLTVISGLPSCIQKVDARYCRSLTSKALSVLWTKVKEMKIIQIAMPKMEIPEWFDSVRTEDIPFFWARRKFPFVALAFMFGKVKEAKIKMDTLEFLPGMMSDMSYTIGLHLFIDGQEISRKDYHSFSVGEDHVLLCDLRDLLNDKEWQGLDACLGDDWKAVQVQCESPLILSRWGVYVYEQETNRDHILFRLPHPNSSGEYMPSSSQLVPKRARQQTEQQLRHAIENFNPREILGEYLPLIESEENPSFTKALVRSMRNAKADTRGEALASVYGASLKREHEESVWDVVRVSELSKEAVPKHIADSHGDDIKIAIQLVDEVMRARVEFMKEKGNGGRLDIDMPIILEECHFDEAPTRRYWGKLEIKHGEPTFNAVMTRTSQLAWGSYDINEAILKGVNFQQKVNVVLLKYQGPSTEEASSSSHGEAVYHDPELEALMRRIEEDAMRLNKSDRKLKASIVLTDNVVSDEYLLEAMMFRGQERLGMLGSDFKKTSYGKLRVEQDAPCTIQSQQKLRVEYDAQRPTQRPIMLKVEGDTRRITQKPIMLKVESDTRRTTQKPIMLKVEGDTRRTTQKPIMLKEESNTQRPTQKPIMLKEESDTQRLTQKPIMLKVESDAQRPTQKPIMLKVESDTQRKARKQLELRVEHDTQRTTQKHHEIRVEHDARLPTQNQHEMRVEHNAQQTTQYLKQHEIRVEHDAQHTTENQTQHELSVEHDAQNPNESQKQHKLGWKYSLIRWALCCK